MEISTAPDTTSTIQSHILTVTHRSDSVDPSPPPAYSEVAEGSSWTACRERICKATSHVASVSNLATAAIAFTSTVLSPLCMRHFYPKPWHELKEPIILTGAISGTAGAVTANLLWNLRGGECFLCLPVNAVLKSAALAALCAYLTWNWT